MCTVSLIPLPGALRLVTSRDERRDRAPAEAPAWHAVPGTAGRALYPLDPVGGGTWVAATEPGGPSGRPGLVLCLLNANPPAAGPTGSETYVSRGRIVTDLLTAADAGAALARLARLPLKMYAPFRLIVAELTPAGEPLAFDALWDRRTLSVTAHEGGLGCWSSSSLGDGLVEGPRRRLFEETVESAPDAARRAAQDAFHAHRWPDGPHLSPRMWRPDARTVSITRVTLAGARAAGPRVHMAYDPLEDEAPAVPVAPRPCAGAAG